MRERKKGDGWREDTGKRSGQSGKASRDISNINTE